MEKDYSVEEKILIDKLKKEFPENIIYSISSSNLYNEIYYLSERRKMKPKEYIKYLGFKSKNKKESIDTEQELIDKLIEIYPDKNINKLSLCPIYYEIGKFAKESNMNNKDYIEKLGFLCGGTKEILYKDEEIVLKLKNILNDKNEYIALSDISNANVDLYTSIKNNAKEKKISTQQYLENLGFVKTGKKSNDIRETYDAYSLNKIINEYDIPVMQMSDLLGCTRENIYRQIRGKISNKNRGGWQRNLVDKEIKEVIDLINTRKYKKINNDNYILILSNKNNFEKKAIIYKNNYHIKCIFNVPEDIIECLQKNYFDILSEKDFEDLQFMNKLWAEQGKILNGKNKVVTIDNNFTIRLRKISENKNMKIDEYLDLLDFQRVDKRFVLTDESIVNRIKKYIVKDNIVRIKSKDEDYAYLAAFASRKKFGGIEGLVNHYGYMYEKGKDTSNVIENHIKTIRERYIVEEKKIYISSYDPYYATLRAFANNKKLSLDDLLNQWGFNRIQNKKDLPNDYIQYDYKEDLQKNLNLKWDDASIQIVLEQLSDKNNNVYVDVESYFYYVLFLKARAELTNINDIIGKLGYNRVYKKNKEDEERTQKVEKLLDKNKSMFIKEKLKELQYIEIDYKEITESKTKIQRNRKLVNILKDLYQGKCQLCGKEGVSIPPIQLLNGTIYSEVHHIKQFSNISCGKDDIEDIDTYKNTIVLCPYHHAYVHYNNGGYNKLVFDNEGNAYLENENGLRIKIITNYHLKK